MHLYCTQCTAVCSLVSRTQALPCNSPTSSACARTPHTTIICAFQSLRQSTCPDKCFSISGRLTARIPPPLGGKPPSKHIHTFRRIAVLAGVSTTPRKSYDPFNTLLIIYENTAQPCYARTLMYALTRYSIVGIAKRHPVSGAQPMGYNRPPYP
jgi:hypothetical protein